jgi:hypothetical protein
LKLYRILYRLPGSLVLSNGTTALRVDDLRDGTREDDSEYALSTLPDGRRAIQLIGTDGRPVVPGGFVEVRDA